MPTWIIIPGSILVGLIIIEELVCYVINHTLFSNMNSHRTTVTQRWTKLKEKIIHLYAYKNRS